MHADMLNRRRLTQDMGAFQVPEALFRLIATHGL
jgi:hypothetical protein